MTRASHTKRRRIRGANPGFTQGEQSGLSCAAAAERAEAPRLHIASRGPYA